MDVGGTVECREVVQIIVKLLGKVGVLKEEDGKRDEV